MKTGRRRTNPYRTRGFHITKTEDLLVLMREAKALWPGEPPRYSTGRERPMTSMVFGSALRLLVEYLRYLKEHESAPSLTDFYLQMINHKEEE